jgi:hypothetical protein
MRDPFKCFPVDSLSRTLFRGSERTGDALAFHTRAQRGGWVPRHTGQGGGGPVEKNEGQIYMYLSHFVCRAYLRSLSSASQRAHVPRTSSGIAHPGVRPRFTRVLREKVQVNQVLPGSKFFLSRG